MIGNLYKPAEVAQILRISKTLAYRLMAQGDLPTVHFSGKTVRCRQEDLEAFILAHANNKQETFPSNDGASHGTQI